MLIGHETALKLKLNGFEDGLNDAIDRLAYQIYQEYREGVDISHQLMEAPMGYTDDPLDAAQRQHLSRISETDEYDFNAQLKPLR